MTDFDESLEAGDLERIRAFVEKDRAYLNGDHRKQFSFPLFSAVEYENFEVLKLLLELGADVNRKDQRGLSALHEAATLGLAEFAKVLIVYGAELEEKDGFGFTPLMWATSAGDIPERIAVARILLEAGVYFDLNSAVSWGDLERVKTILQSNPNAISNAPLPKDLLGASIWGESLELFRILLDAGADPNSVSTSGEPALFATVASSSRDPKFLEELLRIGADKTICSSNGVCLAEFLDGDAPEQHVEVLEKYGIKISL